MYFMRNYELGMRNYELGSWAFPKSDFIHYDEIECDSIASPLSFFKERGWGCGSAEHDDVLHELRIKN
jgi:hypothetical protein